MKPHSCLCLPKMRFNWMIVYLPSYETDKGQSNSRLKDHKAGMVAPCLSPSHTYSVIWKRQFLRELFVVYKLQKSWYCKLILTVVFKYLLVTFLPWLTGKIFLDPRVVMIPPWCVPKWRFNWIIVCWWFSSPNRVNHIIDWKVLKQEC